MDTRHRDWNEMFGFSVQSAPVFSDQPPVQQRCKTALDLADLWAQSVALPEHALQVRAVSMEVRAVARDMRLRREAA